MYTPLSKQSWQSQWQKSQKSPTDFTQRNRDFAEGSCQELCSSGTSYPVPDAYLHICDKGCNGFHGTFYPYKSTFNSVFKFSVRKLLEQRTQGRRGKRHLAKKHIMCLKFSQRKGKFHYFTSSPVLHTSPFLRYFPGGLLLKHPVLVLARRTRLIIAVSRRGTARTWRLFYNISCHCQEGKGVKGSLQS